MVSYSSIRLVRWSTSRLAACEKRYYQCAHELWKSTYYWRLLCKPRNKSSLRLYSLLVVVVKSLVIVAVVEFVQELGGGRISGWIQSRGTSSKYEGERFYEILNNDCQSCLQSSLMLQERTSNTMRFSVEGIFVLDALGCSPHGQCGICRLSLAPTRGGYHAHRMLPKL